jgi:F0F1-type ATP synthase delta subunit
MLIFGMPEIRRLKRELEALDDYMREAAIREAGKQPSLPRLSRLCEGLAMDNHLNLLQDDHRKSLRAFLLSIEQDAPTIHISFAADPSSAFTAKIVTWLRTSIHPYALLQVGLQPTIAAGCVVRTTNKVFDFSLRERFKQTEQKLIDAFEAEAAVQAKVVAAEQPAPAAMATPAAAPVAAATPAPQQAVAMPTPVAPAIQPQGAGS